ncbi:HlyD family secretion protein [Microvirga antarctica]|uniref:HlyD family secretion protein n=1 Tax=Microvirga antarctica TaxID=2819233 RepID=UPI001B30544E|nr:HlyD family secretion protein [Microvirga antarctica]
MAYRDKDSRARGESNPALPREPAPAGNAVATPPAQAPTGAPATGKSGRAKRLVVLVVVAAALIFGGYKGVHWWQTGRFFVSTDDAYVQADITILSAKVSGYVASVAVAHNQSVKAGDLIATLDDGDYRLALQAAKDKLDTQQSAILRIGRQIEAEKASVAQADAQIAAAQADARRAASDFARQQQLAKSDYASKATFESAEAGRDRSDANVRSAQAAFRAAQANVDVLAAQQVEAQRLAAELQTAVAKAERDLSFTEMRAPVDGVVGNKAVEVGTFVQPGTRLAAIVPLESVHVEANFKETQLAAVKSGQTVRIEVDAYPDADITGVIESVSPASGSVFSLLPPENATGNFTKIVQRVPVRIKVSPEVARQGLLRPGMSVVVDVDTRAPANAPKTAER